MFSVAAIISSFSCFVLWRISRDLSDSTYKEKYVVISIAIGYALMAIGSFWLLTQTVVI